tara:strand:+ start:265 stop:435 length:171 start_codon:yes stop_codon:yes gene_type:complete
MNETNKILLLAVAILANVACAKTNKTFVLDPAITYPEERNVAVAVPVIAVEIEVLN